MLSEFWCKDFDLLKGPWHSRRSSDPIHKGRNKANVWMVNQVSASIFARFLRKSRGKEPLKIRDTEKGVLKL